MNPKDIRIEDYNYPLDPEKIARHPLEVRDSCRLLVSDGKSIRDCRFTDLPEVLPAGALMVFNNTRVINARLKLHKSSGAAIEIFCLEPAAPADYERNFASRSQCSWTCLVGNSKKWKEGPLTIDITGPAGRTVLTATRDGLPEGTVQFSWDNPDFSFSDIIAQAGQIPIPPYLNRESESSDAVDYQTVYSHIEGSVAAPTAGLHFTDTLLSAIDAAGVERREVTLHVGAGTFRPVKSDTVGGHDMHAEFITVDRDTLTALRDALAQGRPVVAVGTTSVRTIESLYYIGVLMHEGAWTGHLPQWTPYQEHEPLSASEAISVIINNMESDVFSAYTRIIIAPPYRYRIVSAMVTNFHQPASTLLLLVSAFIGDSWRDIYNHALTTGYRFLSYGDACFFTSRIEQSIAH